MAAELKRAWLHNCVLKLEKLKKKHYQKLFLKYIILSMFTHLWKLKFLRWEKTRLCYFRRQQCSLITGTTIKEATDSQKVLFLSYPSKFLTLLPNLLLNDCPQSYSNIFCSCRKLFFHLHKDSKIAFSLSTNSYVLPPRDLKKRGGEREEKKKKQTTDSPSN